MGVLFAFAASAILFSGVAACPAGCQCSRGELFCEDVQGLDLVVGSPSWRRVVLKKSTLGKVTCGLPKFLVKVELLLFESVEPPSLVCAALSCSPGLAGVSSTPGVVSVVIVQ